MSEVQGGGAACAAHPNAWAVAVCDRCGAYMCEACTEGGLERSCPSCRARTGPTFSLGRDAWTLDALIRLSWQAFVGNIGQLIVATLIAGGVGLVLGLVRNTTVGLAKGNDAALVSVVLVGLLLQYMIQGTLQLGVTDMAFDAVEGQRVTLESLLWHLSKAGKVLIQYLVAMAVFAIPGAIFGAAAYLGISAAGKANAGIAVGVLVVLGIAVLVPLLWVAIPLAFMQYELALDDEVGAIEAIKRSFVLAHGKRWAIVGVMFVAGLIGLAGILACGLGLLVSAPFAQVIMSAFFLTLRNGAGLPPPVRLGRRVREDYGVVPATPAPMP